MSKKNQNGFNNKHFFGSQDAYEEFAEAMMAMAKRGDLPICLRHEEPDVLTMQDIKQFSQRFMQDTGLSIQFQVHTCNDCGKLHCHMIIGEFPEEENEESDRIVWE